MYGLRTQYANVGSAIKKPWRIMSWGVSFDGLHLKCDGSHAHGQCAGRETRVTQLYTEEIVRRILKGLKNRMLLNNAYGRSSRSSHFMNTKGPRTVQASPCIMKKNDEYDFSPDLLSNWIVKRCGVTVRFASHYYPSECRGQGAIEPAPSWLSHLRKDNHDLPGQ